MNRSGNAGFNRLVFFGNRGDGLFLLEGRGCRIPLNGCGRSKRKSRQGAGCEVVCLKANREL